MPNYSRLFAQAVTDSIRDYLAENPELLIPGYWKIKLNTRGYPIPARTYWCDHEPGNPTNVLDRWPPLFLAGEIAGEPADPIDIFGVRDRAESTEAEYRFLCAERAWAKKYAPDEPAANPQRRVDLSKLPLPF